MLRALLCAIGLAVASFCPSCTTGGGSPARVDAAALLPIVSAFADAAVRIHATAAVAELAPELLAVLDANQDGAVELGELAAMNFADPVNGPRLAAVVLLTLERLIRDR